MQAYPKKKKKKHIIKIILLKISQAETFTSKLNEASEVTYVAWKAGHLKKKKQV